MLLGTQMVAKGHHFAGVELAAVVDVDTGLGLPDFRAEERTFQLITQLAGRSGRDAPGRVLVQTFQPDARPVVHAARHDVPRFLTEELERRQALDYPPFAHLVRIVVTGPAIEPVVQALEELKAGIKGAELLGPAALLRLRGKHRAQLVAKTTQPRRIASQAAHLLVRGSAGDAAGGTHRGRRRRSAKLVAMAKRRPEDVIGEWGIRDVTPASAVEREKLLDEVELNPLTRRPLKRRIRRFRAEPDRYLASLGGPLPFMRRLRQIDDEIEALTIRLAQAYAERDGRRGVAAHSPSAGTSAR